MNSIELKVTKSTMSVSNIYTLNQGEYNVDKCVFNFTDDYEGLIKKAVFVYGEEEPIEMVILDNECNIPYELLQTANEFTLKVYAYEVKNEELVQRYSPTPLKIFLREGSYQGSNEVITPSQFEQYEAALNEGLEEVDEALQTMAVATEETNRLNIDVSDKVNKDVTITLTKKDNTTKSVVISDGDDFEYNWDGTKLGVKTDKEAEYQYVDLKGDTGATPNIQIGNVTEGDTPSVTRRGTDEEPILDFTLVKGDTGDTGPTGNGIENIEKTSTSGLVDTYTGTYTNGDTFTFDVTNGADGNVTDVKVEGTSVVDNGVANINGLATQEELDYYKTIYNALPKVEGEGEAVTLNNTANSVMKLKLKGQCKQDSTTGKNIFSGDYSQFNNTGGTGSLYGYFKLPENEETYTLTLIAKDNYTTPSNTYIGFTGNGGDANNGYQWVITSNMDVTKGQVITYSTNTLRYISIYYASETTLNTLKTQFYIQLEKASSFSGYEPYTNGASPNPDYPQTIHEVSGDNTIKVEGKNLCSGVKKITNTLIQLECDLNIQQTITISVIPDDATSNSSIFLYLDGTNAGRVGTITGSANTRQIATITLTNEMYAQIQNASSMFFEIYRSGNNFTFASEPQIENNNQFTSYEPYNGDTYELDLGVENLLTYPYQDSSRTGWTLNSDGTIDVDVNNISGDTMYFNLHTTTPLLLKAGTYTFSIKNASDIRASITNTNGGVISGISAGYSSCTFTLENETNVKIALALNNGKSAKVKLYPQLEVGSKVNSFTPYGQTPIKMRGIGTYEDYFVRNSGKNLFDESVAINNCSVSNGFITITSNTTDVYIQGAYVYSEANKFLTLPSGNYYLKSTNPNVRVTFYGDNGGLDTTSNQPITLASETNFGGIRIRSSSSLQNVSFGIMLSTENIGFEPYGTGKWCKYNAIGNVVLDGSEDYSYFSNYGGYRYINASMNISSTNPSLDIICSHFIVATARGPIAGQLPIIKTYTSTSDSTYIFLCDGTSDVATFKTWLGTHNATLDYVLATPYLSLIEDTNLIEQLDNLEYAMSYEGQTNISQVNNDAPTRINAVALRDLSNLEE